MREIKFRAWDKGMMFPHNCIDYSNFGTHAFFYEKLMQYTGMKDKTGKEIYEGDILRIEGNTVYDMSDELALQNIRIVAYDEDECRFNWARSKSGICFNKNNADNGSFKIIGNIYQNPELIEVDDA